MKYIKSAFSSLYRQSILFVLLSVTVVNVSQAAPIFNSTIISGDSDILNTGTLIVANDIGAKPNAVTVNGVTFGTSQAGLFGFTNGGGDFSIDPFSSDLDTLLSDLVYDPTYGSPASLTLSGLTAGNDYTLQLLFSNDVNETGNNINVNIEGGSYHLVNWQPSAINLTVSFTASSNTVTTFFAPGAGSGGTTGRAVLNAYALHAVAVPEANSIFMLMLGLLGIVLNRKNKETAGTTH